MTDGRATAYSEREREFTFAKTMYQTSRNFLNMLPVTVARYSSDDNAMRYVLPVL